LICFANVGIHLSPRYVGRLSPLMIKSENDYLEGSNGRIALRKIRAYLKVMDSQIKSVVRLNSLSLDELRAQTAKLVKTSTLLQNAAGFSRAGVKSIKVLVQSLMPDAIGTAVGIFKVMAEI
jgi:hypothetical protein